MNKYTLVAAAMFVLLLGSRSLPRAEPTVASAGWRDDFAVDLLTGIGAPVTQPNVDVVWEWTMAEDSSDGAFIRNNPLNTTRQTDRTVGPDFDSDGVKTYADYAAGLEATVETLLLPAYSKVVDALVAGDPERARREIWASPWAGSRYGGGSHWPTRGTARERVVRAALGLMGKPYVYGSRGPDAFDCSGFVQWVWGLAGYHLSDTTYTQLADLRPIGPGDVKAGDAVYFQFPWDQHVGILADVDGDGKWDMIHASDPTQGVIVTHDVFGQAFFADAVIGYRSVL